MTDSYRRMRIEKLQQMTVRNGYSWGVQKVAMNQIMSLLKEPIESGDRPLLSPRAMQMFIPNLLGMGVLYAAGQATYPTPEIASGAQQGPLVWPPGCIQMLGGGSSSGGVDPLLGLLQGVVSLQ